MDWFIDHSDQHSPNQHMPHLPAPLEFPDGLAVERIGQSVQHSDMRQLLTFILVMLIVVSCLLMIRRRGPAESNDDEPGFGVLLTMLGIGAVVTIAAMAFLFALIEFQD